MPRQSRKRRAYAKLCGPRIEMLESRQLLSTITVNTSIDEDDHTDATLSLREAIQVSNGTLAVGALSQQAQAQVVGAQAAINTIDFDIPGAGVHKISLSAAL